MGIPLDNLRPSANSAAESLPAKFGQLVRFFQREVAPYPGRASVVVRITSASTLAMIAIMAARIPYAALGVFYVLAISHRNFQSTLRDGLNILLANAAGVAVLLIGALLFADLPLLHFLFAVLCFFTVFFVTRTLRSYSTAFGFSIVIAAGFPLWDLPYPAWLNTGDTLWLGWGISLCTLITIGTEWAFQLTAGEFFGNSGAQPQPKKVPASALGPGAGTRDFSQFREMFIEDAFSNPEYIQFALKGCLAATVCYGVYSAVAWPGISVAISTCMITAPLFNAQSPMFFAGTPAQRLALRLGGSFTGSVLLGMGLQSLVLPYVDITGFMLVFIAASLIATWFATSSPLMAYLGRQMALGFYLTILQGFSLGASIEVSRDRFAGIWLSLLVMYIIFDKLWPTSMQEAAEERIL